MYTQTPRSFQIGMISKSTVYIYAVIHHLYVQVPRKKRPKHTKTIQTSEKTTNDPKQMTVFHPNSIRLIYPKGPIFSLSIFAAMWVKGSFKPRISTDGTDGSQMAWMDWIWPNGRIFHQPRFAWNKGDFPILSHHLGWKTCEVARIWPAWVRFLLLAVFFLFFFQVQFFVGCLGKWYVKFWMGWP